MLEHLAPGHAHIVTRSLCLVFISVSESENKRSRGFSHSGSVGVTVIGSVDTADTPPFCLPGICLVVTGLLWLGSALLPELSVL